MKLFLSCIFVNLFSLYLFFFNQVASAGDWLTCSLGESQWNDFPTNGAPGYFVPLSWANEWMDLPESFSDGFTDEVLMVGGEDRDGSLIFAFGVRASLFFTKLVFTDSRVSRFLLVNCIHSGGVGAIGGCLGVFLVLGAGCGVYLDGSFERARTPLDPSGLPR